MRNRNRDERAGLQNAFKTSLMSATAVIALGLGMPATAQTAAAQPAAGNTASSADIVVTARRVEERLQDVPISIKVFSQTQLNEHNITNGEDLAKYTPSLSVQDPLGPNNISFSIRGFTQSTGTAPSVAVYFADVVAPRGGFASVTAGDGAGPGSFFDLQNVQVLKGPQGTLFGRNTTGGAILLVPQKPTDELSGYIEGSYGNYNEEREQGALNIPLSDTFRARLAFDNRQRDGYLKNYSGIGPDRFNAINYFAGRISIVGDLTPNLENYTIFSYSRSNTAGTVGAISNCNPAAFLGGLACQERAGIAAQTGSFYAVANDLAKPIDKLEQWQVINTTTWKASDTLTIKNITSYSQIKDDYQTDAVGTDFTVGPFTLPFADIVALPGYHNADQSTLTEEFRLQGNSADSRLTWQGGLYYEKSQPLAISNTSAVSFLACSNAFALQCINPLGFGSISVTNGETSFSNLGVYGQGNYAFTDQLKLTAGLRYSNDLTQTWSSAYNYRFPAPGTTVVACSDPAAQQPGITPVGLQGCRLNFRQRSSAPTWLVDIDYTPSQDLLVYAKYTRGYRQGSTDAQAAEGYKSFQPEKVDSFEAGLKATAAHGPVKGTFDLAAFYNNFTHQQLQAQFNQANGVAAAGIVNAGKSRIYGFEVETALNFFDYLSLSASYSYLNSKLVSEQAITIPAGGLYVSGSLGAIPGDPLPFTPKSKLSTTGTVYLPIPKTIGKLSFSATYTYTSSQFISRASPFGTVQPTKLVDLNLDWKGIAGTPFDLSGFVTNVANKKYYTYINTIYLTTGVDSGIIAPPRMYGLRLRYAFRNGR